MRDPRARRIKLSVDERGARLTLPLRASLVAGERFLHEHRDWLALQLAAQGEHAGEGLLRGVTDSLPLRGDEVPLRWTAGARRGSNSTPTTACCSPHPPRAGDAGLRRALRDFYEAQGRADVGRWLPGYLDNMPRAPRRIVFKRTSSQWGSLAPDGTLSLDLSLVLARPSAFEYVLVHELCHLLHADHSRRFWREVEARFPDWRDERHYFHAEGRRLKARLRRCWPVEPPACVASGRTTKEIRHDPPCHPPVDRRRTHRPARRAGLQEGRRTPPWRPRSSAPPAAKVDVDKDGDTDDHQDRAGRGQGRHRRGRRHRGAAGRFPERRATCPPTTSCASAMDMGGMQMLNMTTAAGTGRRVSPTSRSRCRARAGSARWRCRPAAAVTLMYSKDKRQVVYQMLKADEGGTQLAIRTGEGG